MGEHVISRIDYIRYLLKALILGRGDTSIDLRALNAEAGFQDLIRAGKLSPDDLSNHIRSLESNNVPIAIAFYSSAVRNMGEEVRHALFRAGYRLRTLTERLCRINATESARNYPGAPSLGPCERQSIGKEYDIVSYEFTELITASFSALDYLYRFFLFVVRRPAGDPARPKKLHFPDTDPTLALIEAGGARNSDLSASAAPFAIPNLTPKRFGSLRRARNDIAHNFGTDDIRPIVYIGIPAPPKNPLQYTQYTIRDIAPDGTPTSHAWCEQFYRHDRDAQESAYEYLESCWNCVLDTLEWLAVRFRAECRAAGISVLDAPGQDSISCNTLLGLRAVDLPISEIEEFCLFGLCQVFLLRGSGLFCSKMIHYPKFPRWRVGIRRTDVLKPRPARPSFRISPRLPYGWPAGNIPWKVSGRLGDRSSAPSQASGGPC